MKQKRIKDCGATVQKMVARINADKTIGIEITQDALFSRTYAGYWQQSLGAWSWSISEGKNNIGSQFPMRELLTKDFWDIGHTGNDIDINF